MNKKELINRIKKVGIKGIRDTEENKDPQFFALKELKRKVNDDRVFLKLVIINALLSFQLSTSGEVYWKEFSEEINIGSRKNVFEMMEEFLRKKNKRVLKVKLARLKRIRDSGLLRGINRKTPFYELWKRLENLFGSGKKTTSFAIKMFGYAKRITTHRFVPYPMDIPIPVDSRVEKFTKNFLKRREMNKKEIAQFWQGISYEVDIPPLHLDSLIWNVFYKEVFGFKGRV